MVENTKLSRAGIITFGVIAVFTLARAWVLASPAMPLSMDEAQYWLWSRDLGFGYYSKPPLLAWVIAGTTALCGDAEGCIRLSSPLFHAGTAFLLFGIGRQVFNRHVGAWSAVTYIALPGVSVSSVVASTDAPLLFFWALALYALVRVRDDAKIGHGKIEHWVLLGAALGLGTLSKYAMLFFVLGLAIWAVAERDARQLLWSRGAGVAAVVAVLIMLPNVLWNADHAFVSVMHVADNMALGQARFSFADVFDFIGAQAGILGPLLFVAFVGALIRPPPQFKTQFKLLAWFCLPVLLIMTAQAFMSRAHANWAATAYIAAVPVVVAWCLARNWAGWLRVSWVLHVIAAGVIYNYETVAQSLGITLNRKIDPAVRTRSWDAAGAWTSSLAREFPGEVFLFDERHTFTALSYYTRPHLIQARLWNPLGTVSNHFEMTASLKDPSPQSFIYVTRQPTAETVSPFFLAEQPLGRWHRQSYPGHDLQLYAFRLTGFRGYTGAPPSP